ncbi:Uncharacterized protein dnm_027560 [Desulfonema magnum]|uniref:Uncharacterized protein n=1 Tax=Desulfonema magnum TaxID=45655 RepID=A0A975BK32_9BACT|nr:Uncharacterized protein dnm_027560 [Desulfonema magnum]
MYWGKIVLSRTFFIRITFFFRQPGFRIAEKNLYHSIIRFFSVIQVFFVIRTGSEKLIIK